MPDLASKRHEFIRSFWFSKCEALLLGKARTNKKGIRRFLFFFLFIFRKPILKFSEGGGHHPIQ